MTPLASRALLSNIVSSFTHSSTALLTKLQVSSYSCDLSCSKCSSLDLYIVAKPIRLVYHRVYKWHTKSVKVNHNRKLIKNKKIIKSTDFVFFFFVLPSAQLGCPNRVFCVIFKLLFAWYVPVSNDETDGTTVSYYSFETLKNFHTFFLIKTLYEKVTMSYTRWNTTNFRG